MLDDGTAELVQGFLDGYSDDRDELPVQSNRSDAYRHGWLNGRDDRLRKPRAPAHVLREIAERVVREFNTGVRDD